MALYILPDPKFPITHREFNPLMDLVVQLNLLDAGLSEQQQRGLGLFFHIHDLYAKSGGKIDYRGKDGHRRLMEDAAAFAGEGNPTAVRHGDLAAAHLALDFSDTQTRCIQHKMPLLSTKVSELLVECADLCSFPPQTEKRVGLLMDWLGRKPNP